MDINVNDSNSSIIPGGYAQRIANLFLEGLKNNTSPFIKPWEPIGPIVPDYNPCTSNTLGYSAKEKANPKPYKGMNSVVLFATRELMGWEDPRWVTYMQANKSGWSIKKQSRGTTISFVSFCEANNTNKGADIEEDMVTDSRKRRLVPIFKYYTVFNAAQIAGMPPLDPPESIIRTFNPIPAAQAIVEKANPILLHDQRDKAFYSPSKDEIHLPPQVAFKSEPLYYTTLLHEMGHWTGHESRLNRGKGNAFGSTEYAKEELRAEISSYMVAKEIGIPFDPSGHILYVNSWIKIIEDNPKEMLNACVAAERISNYLINGPRELTRESSRAKSEGIER